MAMTVQELFDKIHNAYSVGHEVLNRDYDKLTDTKKAYDEGYINALESVLRLMSETVIKG